MHGDLESNGFPPGTRELVARLNMFDSLLYGLGNTMLRLDELLAAPWHMPLLR
eukprot:gene3855-13917_t